MFMKNLSVKELKLQQNNVYLPVLSNKSDQLVSIAAFQNNNDSNIRVAKVITGLKEYSVYAPKKEGKITLDLNTYNAQLCSISSARYENDRSLSTTYDNAITAIDKLTTLCVYYISQEEFAEKIENKTLSNGVNVIIYDNYNMNNKKITNLGVPINSNDAVNKKYFDENTYAKLSDLQKKFNDLTTEIDKLTS